VGVEAAAIIQQMTSEELEQTSLAFKNTMEQGKGAVSKLRAETVMSVVVTGTRGGCEKNRCGEDTTIFFQKAPVGSGPLSPHSKNTERQRETHKQPTACITKRHVLCSQQPVEKRDKCRHGSLQA